MKPPLRAFTIIELIVAASVIGIIAAIVTANLNESRVRARDANRTESVRAYGTALEQWKVSNGNYFVYMKSAGGQPTCQYILPGNGFMSCAGASAVGFQGGGAGGMTRKKLDANDPNPASYSTNSVADALVSSGFLARVRLDPLDTEFNTNTDSNDKYSDFILTLCEADSSPTKTIKGAQEYAIFTILERPDTNSQAIADAHCGGPTTPSGGWNALIAR